MKNSDVAAQQKASERKLLIIVIETYGNPSILQTTLASGRSHLSSHIEPHAEVLLNLTNTVPLLRALGCAEGGIRYTSI